MELRLLRTKVNATDDGAPNAGEPASTDTIRARRLLLKHVTSGQTCTIEVWTKNTLTGTDVTWSLAFTQALVVSQTNVFVDLRTNAICYVRLVTITGGTPLLYGEAIPE